MVFFFEIHFYIQPQIHFYLLIILRIRNVKKTLFPFKLHVWFLIHSSNHRLHITRDEGRGIQSRMTRSLTHCSHLEFHQIKRKRWRLLVAGIKCERYAIKAYIPRLILINGTRCCVKENSMVLQPHRAVFSGFKQRKQNNRNRIYTNNRRKKCMSVSYVP